ncbi:hypothetical protein UlMin_041739 [Ulmus minor]
MDVEASAKPTMVIDYDVDTGPMVFKRRISKQNQLNSEVKKPISKMQDGHSRRQISRGHPLNGVNSGSHKGKLLQSSKASLAKSPLASPKASSIKVSSVKPSSSVKPPSSVKSPVINLKTSTSSGGQSKFTSEQKNSVNQPTKSAVVKEEKNSDSEDEKPLSDRLKRNSNHSSKGLGKSSTGSTLPLVSKNIVKPSPDLDDEPLSTRFPAKSNAMTPGSKNYDYDDKKPLSSINQLNGSTKKPLAVPTKKPLDKENSSSQSSVKKPKLSDSPALMKNKQVSTKVEPKVDDDDHIPISQRIKKSTVSNSKSSSTKQPLKKVVSSSFKKTNKKMKKTAQNSKYSKSTKVLPISGDGQKKWTTLVHNGVIFPPAYKPHGVKMLYNGKPVDLTPEQEEVGSSSLNDAFCSIIPYSIFFKSSYPQVATMFTVMKDIEYVQKQTFRHNFWTDWRKLLGKNHVIQNLDTCDFTPIYDWYQNEKEQKKQMSTDEKKALKEDKSKQEEKYMWAIVDDVKEKVSNFRVEPPGLFRGHEEHPKSGKLKRRIHPSDVTINIGKDAPLPKCPIPGERWREIRHDNIVTWLAFWNDPINPREFKYVFLAASSSLRGKDYIAKIRQAYERDFTSSDVKQVAGGSNIPRDYQLSPVVYQPSQQFHLLVHPAHRHLSDTFRKGLLPDGELYKDLTKFNCSTMEEALARAWIEIRWEEDELYRTRRIKTCYNAINTHIKTFINIGGNRVFNTSRYHEPRPSKHRYSIPLIITHSTCVELKSVLIVLLANPPTRHARGKITVLNKIFRHEVLLKQHHNCFAWSHKDMTGIDPDIAVQKL